MNRISVFLALLPALACACGATTVAASDQAPQLPKTQPMANSRSEKVEIWVSLTEAPVAGSPKGQLEAVKRQQDAVMAQLKVLGATELARVTTSNNALAVAIDAGKVPEVKRIAGVRSVSAVQHIEREPLPTPPTNR